MDQAAVGVPPSGVQKRGHPDFQISDKEVGGNRINRKPPCSLWGLIKCHTPLLFIVSSHYCDEKNRSVIYSFIDLGAADESFEYLNNTMDGPQYVEYQSGTMPL